MDNETQKAINDLRIELNQELDNCTEQLVGGEEFDEAVGRIEKQTSRLNINDEANGKAIQELFAAYKDILKRLESIESHLGAEVNVC